MDIVCCTDNNYIKYCCVMLTSLLENNKEENITIHILGDNLTSDSQNTITNIVEEKYNQHLCLYAVDRKLVVDFPNMGSYVSLTTYYKISGITSKNGRNDAKRLNIRVVTVSNDDKPKNRETQRKADLRRRMVCKSLPVKE